MFKSRREWVVLGFILVAAFFLRVMYLPQRALTFGFDQARDAFIAGQILAGDIKVQGPSASTPGLYHGVLYYYVLVPAYAVSRDPIVAGYWIALLSCLGVGAVFLLGRDLTGKMGVGMLAAVLYAVGFKQVQYGTWLSNPTIGVWLVPLTYLGLWWWLTKGKNLIWPAVLCGLALGATIQAEIFLAYHLLVVWLWLVLARGRITRRQVVYFGLSLILAVSPMIVAQVKFGMTGVTGLVSLFASPSRPFGYSRLGDFAVLYLNQLGEVFTKDIFPLNEGWGGAWGILCVVSLAVLWWRGRKEGKVNPYLFVLSYVLAHVSVVSLGGVTTPFLTVGLGAAAVLATSLVLGEFWQRKRRWLVAFLVAVFIAANLMKVVTEDRKGSTLFAIQPDMLLSKQLAAVDYTYESAGGEKFSINTVTSPLWINTVWAYLYDWYGKSRYGYLPEWHGRDQVGQLGGLPSVSAGTKLYYFIQEPPEGIPQSFREGEIGTEEARSKLVEEKSFGEVVVQKRMRRDETKKI